MSGSGHPNERLHSAAHPDPLEDSSTLQGILTAWNLTNQQLVQIQLAITKLTYILLGTYTVATLPPNVPEGTRTQVSDSNSTTFNNAVAGGGANHIGVIYLSGVWRIG